MPGINTSAPSPNPPATAPDRISSSGDVLSHKGKQAALYLVSAKGNGNAPLRRRPRRDLVFARDNARKSMLRMADFFCEAIEGSIFRPVDHHAERGLFEPAPEDRQAMRISQSALEEFQALHQQMLNFIRSAPIVRGPGDCQSLRLVTTRRGK